MTPIQLAFIIDDKNNQLPRLISQVNSIPNKVGGLPIWLDPYHPLGGADCSECKLSMPLLAQLYCPEDYPENAFHRVIYVFCCRNGRCHKGQKNAFAVFRSQLPLHNKLYDIDGFWIKHLAVEDFILKAEDVATHTGYCRLCGKLGTSVCGNCRKARYCSKEHQKLDWKQGLHYEYCESPDSPPAVINDWITSFQFPEYELAEDEEPARKLDELQKDIEDKLIVEADDKYLVEEEETQTDVDKVFLKFQKRISLAPSQVLRYGRVNPDGKNEDPLWVSDIGIPESIPRCPHCNSERTFEFQLTPQLLTYLEIDNKPIDSLDWGTLLIYTCNSHCDAANGKYAKEFIIKQQFSSAGLGDSIRKQLDNRK